MPYIVIKSSREEIDRQELTAKVVIGRAPECDITVKDIQLSRRHCRLEETIDGWCLIDLGSKNGTSINGQRVLEWKVLSDGDVVTLGQTRMIFHTGVPGEDVAVRLMSPNRPVDPNEALAGTVSGFQLVLPGEGDVQEDMPCPQPSPILPGAFDREELHSLLTAIASSSWDSIYAEARQPTRKITRPVEDQPRRRSARPRSPIDLSLQVNSSAGSKGLVEDFDTADPIESPLDDESFENSESLMEGSAIDESPVEGTSLEGFSIGQSDAGDFPTEIDQDIAEQPAEARRATKTARWHRLIPYLANRPRASRPTARRRRLRWVALTVWISAGALLMTHWLSMSGMFTPQRTAASPMPIQSVLPVSPALPLAVPDAPVAVTVDVPADQTAAVAPADPTTPAGLGLAKLISANPFQLTPAPDSPKDLPPDSIFDGSIFDPAINLNPALNLSGDLLDPAPDPSLPGELPIAPLLRLPSGWQPLDLRESNPANSGQM